MSFLLNGLASVLAPPERTGQLLFHSAGEKIPFAKKIYWQTSCLRRHIYLGMPEAKERAAEILHGPKGTHIYLFLVDHAKKIARRYGWRTGKTLPQGASPDSVVDEVIVKVLRGLRTWDGASETSFIYALQGMIRSDIGHLFENYEVQVVESFTLPIGNKIEAGEDRERTADDFPSAFPNPEEHLLEKEQKTLEEVAYELILKSVEDKDELSAVTIALHDTDSPAEISSQTKIPIERVRQLLRTLYRKAAALRLPVIERQAQRRKR